MEFAGWLIAIGVLLVAIHAVCAALDAALERRGLMEAGPVCRQAS